MKINTNANELDLTAQFLKTLIAWNQFDQALDGQIKKKTSASIKLENFARNEEQKLSEIIQPIINQYEQGLISASELLIKLKVSCGIAK